MYVDMCVCTEVGYVPASWLSLFMASSKTRKETSNMGSGKEPEGWKGLMMPSGGCVYTKQKKV